MKDARYEIQAPPARQHESVDIMLAEWRRKATNAGMVTMTIVFFPLVALIATGLGQPVTMLVKMTALGSYAVFLFQTLLWWTDYRVRARVNIALGYMLAFVGGTALPQGPFMRAAPVVLPIIAMVILGKRAGRVAAGVSVIVLLCTPMLCAMPHMVGILTLESAEWSLLARTLWPQSLALTALLIAEMVLLDRFHDLLMQSLAQLQNESRKLSRSMAESKRLERELIRIADEERRRLGQEIHDGVCQQLTGVLLGIGALSRKLGRKGSVAVDDLSGLSSLVEESIDEARGVARGLCPLNKDAGALATALHVLAKRTSDTSGIPVAFITDGDVNVDDSSTANHLYRIAQEALNNAVRHAHPNRIRMVLRGGQRELLLEVEDDGGGLPLEISKEGMGLRTMAHRANLLEAEFAATRIEPKGTRVSCRVSRTDLKPRDEQEREGAHEE